MAQIFRIIKPEIGQICRCYGNHRNLHSHYETLGLASNATQKDIRQAFLKLSKEVSGKTPIYSDVVGLFRRTMHPDLSKKSNHADFVKVNEAYQILNKEHTRRMYDMKLHNVGRTSNGRPFRVVYYDPTKRNEWGEKIHGIKGRKSISKVTILLVCMMASSVGVVVQIVAIKKAIANNNTIFAESLKHAETYRKVKLDAQSKSFEEQIADYKEKFATRE